MRTFAFTLCIMLLSCCRDSEKSQTQALETPSEQYQDEKIVTCEDLMAQNVYLLKANRGKIVEACLDLARKEGVEKTKTSSLSQIMMVADMTKFMSNQQEIQDSCSASTQAYDQECALFMLSVFAEVALLTEAGQ